jgi:hypothetical protein
VGRPRLRWLGDAENDLRELKVNKWRQKANNKEEWTSVIKETEVHRGLQKVQWQLNL